MEENKEELPRSFPFLLLGFWIVWTVTRFVFEGDLTIIQVRPLKFVSLKLHSLWTTYVGTKYAFGFVNYQLTSRNYLAQCRIRQSLLSLSLISSLYSLGLSLELMMGRNVNDLMVFLIIIFKSIKLYNDVLRIAYKTQRITFKRDVQIWHFAIVML